jgi:predicted oxidoreductase (fatty acid repression mutant protein)
MTATADPSQLKANFAHFLARVSDTAAVVMWSCAASNTLDSSLQHSPVTPLEAIQSKTVMQY